MQAPAQRRRVVALATSNLAEPQRTVERTRDAIGRTHLEIHDRCAAPPSTLEHVYRDLATESLALLVAAAFLSIGVGYAASRVLIGVHYFTDAVVGAILSTIVKILPMAGASPSVALGRQRGRTRSRSPPARPGSPWGESRWQRQRCARP